MSVLLVCAFFIFSGPRPLFAADAPMTELLEAWSPVEAALREPVLSEGGRPAPALFSALAHFQETFEDFISTRLYAEYEGKGYVERREDVRGLAPALSAAMKTGNRAETIRTSSLIREKLAAWQRVEIRVSGRAFTRLFNFFIVFILIICGMVVILWFLRRDLQKSRVQEWESTGFLRMTMLAQESERSRIASELHDTVLQDMGRLLHSTAASAAAGELLDLERRIMNRTREVCLNLMPPDFSRLFLEDSLTQLCMDFNRRSGLECRAAIASGFSAKGFLPEAQLQIYRIVQEALTNVEKHARASEAVLTVRNVREGASPAASGDGRAAILVCVSDDGAGLPAAFSGEGFRGGQKAPEGGAAWGGLGIRGMYERAAILGADLSFQSEPGGGTTVRLEIPQNAKEINSAFPAPGGSP